MNGSMACVVRSNTPFAFERDCRRFYEHTTLKAPSPTLAKCRVFCPHRTRFAAPSRGARLVSAHRSQIEVLAGLEVQQQIPKKNLAVFVSGGGSNLKALHAATQDGRIHGTVAVVVSDKPGCGGWEWAKENSIPTYAFPPKKGEPGLSSSEMVDILQSARTDYICLAGFLKLVPQEILKAYPKAVLNIHPALLPAFGGKGYYGMHVHNAVVASGARVSGPTVHFIDEEYDKGTIIAQRPVPVYPTDSPTDVAQRVLEQEHIVFAEVIGALCRGDFCWREDGVIMIKVDTENDDCKFV